MESTLCRYSPLATHYSHLSPTKGIRPPGSAGKAAGVEEGLLLGPGGTAQHRVAVREAAEAADDVGMLLGIFGESIIAVAARQHQAVFLVRKILRMHERQIEKLALGMRELPVEASGDRTIRDGTGERVSPVGAGVAAEHIARELVEHDGERECALRRLFPR